MKHQYEDYIKWIDEKIKEIRYEELLQEQLSNLIEVMVASLLANKATLERHKADKENLCSECTHCGGNLDDWELVIFPCPSLLDVTNQLDEVMG